MTPSKQQQAIYDEYDNTNNNIFVSATAGSGKTKTIVDLSKRTPTYKKSIFLAFSKAIAEELRERLPDHIEVATIHSKAYSILRYNFRMNTKLNELKNWVNAKKINKKKFKNKNEENSYYFVLSQIMNLMKLNLIKPYEEEKIQELCDNYGVLTLNGEIADTIKLFNYTESLDYNQRGFKENIDFTDMLYLAYTKVDEKLFPKYDVVTIDELQDVNVLQREMLLRMLKPNGRLVGVGDEKQTIFSFQGSSLDTFHYIKNRPKTTVLPLSTTYRCAKNIVKEAHNYFTDIEANESNQDGIVRDGLLSEAKSGDFVLCRNNLPLFKAFIFFLKRGVKSYILGKDFQKNLLNLSKKINSIEDINEILQNKIQQLEDKQIKSPHKHPAYIDLEEKCQILEMMVDEYGSLSEANNMIDKMFGESNKDRGVILSTIHKSKGLEADRVFWLNKDLMFNRVKTEMDSYAEQCLCFVAVTRAKKELVYCNIKID
jgi:superfamily I DNA/RNA helicase